jgi:hypothetical protein
MDAGQAARFNDEADQRDAPYVWANPRANILPDAL